MVRDAPVFAEIADGFVTFMGDAIFVAHSVNFDYGFMASEYERWNAASDFQSFAHAQACAAAIRATNLTASAISVRSTKSSWKSIIAHYATHERPRNYSI